MSTYEDYCAPWQWCKSLFPSHSLSLFLMGCKRAQLYWNHSTPYWLTVISCSLPHFYSAGDHLWGLYYLQIPSQNYFITCHQHGRSSLEHWTRVQCRYKGVKACVCVSLCAGGLSANLVLCGTDSHILYVTSHRLRGADTCTDTCRELVHNAFISGRLCLLVKTDASQGL